MREKITLTLQTETITVLKQVKEEVGMPIGRQLENAWKETRKVKQNG